LGELSDLKMLWSCMFWFINWLLLWLLNDSLRLLWFWWQCGWWLYSCRIWHCIIPEQWVLNNNLLTDRIIVNGELVRMWKVSGCGLFQLAIPTWKDWEKP
jgi:hypothetical protein